MIFDSMVKIVIVAIISIIFILILKPHNEHISLLLTLITSILIFLCIIPYLNSVLNMFKDFSVYVDYETIYLDVVLKIICISYICEVGVELCKDAGISSIASKIELGGKVLIMVVSIPIIQEVLKTVVTIL